jgi:hypothetical protein
MMVFRVHEANVRSPRVAKTNGRSMQGATGGSTNVYEFVAGVAIELGASERHPQHIQRLRHPNPATDLKACLERPWG